ncbi:hypothetical protein [Luteitalea sp.]|jgi:hypothetical protein|uniref:hypothetical protein n=1 Tax=Luteitalea sp. TaxID=2004800 RepID=UPI0037C5FB9D
MRYVKMAVLALVAAAAVGCISIDSVVKIKADGSGTMEQTMLINSSAMGMMGMMGGGDAKAAPKIDPATIFSKEKLQAQAAELGEGVTFVSSEPVTQGDMKGVRAVYAFKDFNTLKVSTALPDMDQGAAKATGKGEPLPIKFTRGAGSSMLTMNMLDELAKADAKKKAEPTKTAGTPEMPKEMLAMLAPMFKDMRVAIAVEPVGTLVRTNATHVQGKRVTLFDVAFGELFANPAGIETMEKLGSNPSLTEIQAALKGMKGIKINEVEKLEIEFR